MTNPAVVRMTESPAGRVRILASASTLIAVATGFPGNPKAGTSGCDHGPEGKERQAERGDPCAQDGGVPPAPPHPFCQLRAARVAQ